jgi:hypothetical protein
MRMPALFRDHGRLAGDLKPLSAAHVLAGHHVVFADHVRTRFSETSAVAVVGASGKLALLRTHHPCDFILGRLMAVRAIEGGCFLFLALVEKLAFFHSFCGDTASAVRRSEVRNCPHDYYSFVTTVLWQHGKNYGPQEKIETVSCRDGGQGVGTRACRPPSGGKNRHREKEKAGKTQTNTGKVIERVGIASAGLDIASIEMLQ